MDYNDPSRRQYAQQGAYAPQQSQSSGQSGSQYGTPGGSVERFRQSTYMQQSPTTVPSTGRASGDAQVYSFAQSSQYGSAASAAAQTMQYATDLQSPADPRSQDTQQYSQYGSNVMYGMSQPAQTATQSPYDQVSRYSSQRPGTASETLVSSFGVPQTAAQYYLAGQSLPSATAPELAAPHLPSQYPQSAYAGAGPSSTYASAAMLDPTQPGAYSYATAATQYAPNSSTSVDQAFSNYQHNIRTIFSNVREGTLRDLGGHLLEVSHYLLGNAEALGLTRDDDNLHDERIRLWDEFNRAWLTTLQKQFDVTQEWIRSGGGRDSPSIMSQQVLEHLSRELVRLCDSVEKHGLVDYQMGVAEEEIMDLLLRCLSLLDPESATAGAESSASASARER